MQKDDSKLLRNILLVVGAIAAIGAIAYGVYRFFIEDDYDEFDEDFYFDDDDIADLLDEEDD